MTELATPPPGRLSPTQRRTPLAHNPNPAHPAPLIDLGAIRDHHRDAETTRTLAALWTAAADIPVLLAEIGRLHSLLILARIRHADLTAAAHAVDRRRTRRRERSAVVHPRRTGHQRQAPAPLAQRP